MPWKCEMPYDIVKNQIHDVLIAVYKMLRLHECTVPFHTHSALESASFIDVTIYLSFFCNTTSWENIVILAKSIHFSSIFRYCIDFVYISLSFRAKNIYSEENNSKINC